MNKECVFCKKNKYKKKVSEKLMQFLEFRAVDSIKKSATLKNDFMMLSLLSEDLIVLEGHYQKCCDREYTQKLQNLLISSNESQSFSGNILYKDVECEALRENVKEYYEQIIEVPKVLRYIFSSKDIIVRDSTRQYLLINLKIVNIIIFQKIEGKLYVYSTSLTTEQLVILYVNAKTGLDHLKKQMVTLTLLTLETQQS